MTNNDGTGDVVGFPASTNDEAAWDPWPPQGTAMPQLARGIRWSDVLADIERDNELRRLGRLPDGVEDAA